jgi:hypothetical protein
MEGGLPLRHAPASVTRRCSVVGTRALVGLALGATVQRVSPASCRDRGRGVRSARAPLVRSRSASSRTSRARHPARRLLRGSRPRRAMVRRTCGPGGGRPGSTTRSPLGPASRGSFRRASQCCVPRACCRRWFAGVGLHDLAGGIRSALDRRHGEAGPLVAALPLGGTRSRARQRCIAPPVGREEQLGPGRTPGPNTSYRSPVPPLQSPSVPGEPFGSP